MLQEQEIGEDVVGTDTTKIENWKRLKRSGVSASKLLDIANRFCLVNKLYKVLVNNNIKAEAAM